MSSTENICVHVRVRPLNDAEKALGKAWKVEGNSIQPADQPAESTNYTLDNVFDGNSSTEEVYVKTTKALISQVVEGFNSTVFAYGQTSSGKTHTMRGTEEDPGLVPRAVQDIFNLISAKQDREFLLRVSYMELYNEDINDLLAPENQKLQCHESKEAGVYVAGLREEIVAGPQQVLELLEEGERFRHIGETKMNKASSRSHTVFRMVIESRSKEVNSEDGDFGAIRVSTLTLVDLAGSERIAKTGAEGQRMKEGAAINKSLLTLGTVINKLSEGAQLAGLHIPYRDSKLTRILQPSLGGNAKTAIICAVTPATQHVEETHSTLRFACRAKRVVNNATVNEVVSDAAVLKRQAKEIEELRKILQRTGNTHIDEEIDRMRAELLRKDQENDRMQLALAAEKEERERAQRKVDNMTKLMLDSSRASHHSPTGGSGGAKPTRDNRRETWCPGAGARKRPLLPANQLASLLEGEESWDGSTLTDAQQLQRKSDGAALGLGMLPSSGVSPPLKMSRSMNMEGIAEGGEEGEEGELIAPPRRPSFVRASMGLALSNPGAMGTAVEDVIELQAQVRELEKANELMQRELEAVTESAAVTQKQLKDAEDELMSVADERDSLSLRVKEAEWKARQAERDAAEHAASLEAAAEAAAAAEQQLQELQQDRNAAGGELEERMDSLRKENGELKERVKEVEGAKDDLQRQLTEVSEEKTRLEAKAAARKASVQEAEDKLQAKLEEMESLKAAQEGAEARCADAEARSRQLYEEVSRLTAHISDLESRKRAPLYQKKQEDELRAVTERAAEAEIRAAEAEIRCKEAKTLQEAAQKELEVLKLELTKVKEEASEEASDFTAQKEALLQRAAADAEKAAARHEQALTELINEQELVAQAKDEVESRLKEAVAEIEGLRKEAEAAQEGLTAAQAQLEETQQCADAAAEHVRFLEEKAEQESAAHDAATAELTTKIESLTAELASAAQAAVDAAAVVAAEHAAAMEQAQQEKDALQAVVDALEVTKAELEARVATAAGALNAADELKELRRKYKEETIRLNQALKSASMGSKGNEKAADRAQKDIDRLRNQVKDLEGKLRVAVQDKNNAQMEKAGVERELRQFKAQHEKLSKNMDKIHSMEDKKRETIMVGLNQTKSRLQQAEDSLHRAQIELERCQFDLQSKTGECTQLETELSEAKAFGEQMDAERDELSQKLALAEDELAGVKEEAKALRVELASVEEALNAANEKLAGLEESTAQLEDEKAMLVHEKMELNAALEAVQAELQEAVEKLASAEARLPEIAELSTQLEVLTEELNATKESAELAGKEAEESMQSMQEECAKLQARIEDMVERHTALTEEKSALLAEKEELTKATEALTAATEELTKDKESLLSQQETVGAELAAAVEKCSSLESTLAEKESYVSSLEAQINDAMAEGMETKAAADSAAERCAALEEQYSAVQAQLEEARAQIGTAQEQLQELESVKEAAGKVEERLQEVTAQLTAAQAAAEAANDKIIGLDAELVTARGSYTDLETQHKEVAERATAADALVAELNESLEGARREMEGLRAERVADEQQLNALRAELDALKNAADSDAHELQGQVAAAAVAVEEWKGVAAKAQAAHTELASQFEAAQQELEALRDTAEATEKKLAALEEQHASVDAVHATLQADLRSKEESVSELQAAAQAAVRAAQELQGDLAAERQRASDLEAELGAVRMQARAEQQRLTRDLELALEHAEHGQANAAAEEEAERKVAVLNTRVQQLESQLHHAMEECQELSLKAQAAAAGVHGSAEAAAAHSALELKVAALESDLRKSRRREEKLQALQYRLREDIKASGGDLASFDELKNVRGLEYELDRVANRASREKAILREQLEAAKQRIAHLESTVTNGAGVLRPGSAGKKVNVSSHAIALSDKENMVGF